MADEHARDGLERLFNFALARQQAGDLAQAIQAYAEILERQPDHAQAANNLGNVMLAMGHGTEAEACFAQALAVSPEMVEAIYNRARLYQLQGRAALALDGYHQVLERAPELVSAAYNRAILLRELEGVDAAVDAYRQLLARSPDYADAWSNLGKALRERGEVAEALAAFERAVELAPNDAEIASNRLFCLLHDERPGSERLLHAQEAYAGRFSAAPGETVDHRKHDRDPHRTLRVGMVSPDFRDHPVGRFVEPLLDALDHRQIVPVALSTAPVEDALSKRLRAGFAEWHDLYGIDDAVAAREIAALRIDVLIDLAGHTAGNRLCLFARRPAPVQATWLGYLGSTGLKAIDWRLTDGRCDPPGFESLHAERLMRLPGCQWCYRRPEAGVPLAEPASAGVRLASFAGSAKLSDTILDLWARLLTAIPEARLLLVGIPPGRARQRIVERLAAVGAAAAVDIQDRLPMADYLARLGSVDIVLDTWPYAGGTTTCEALWMGVPVLTLAGERSCSRSGASLLTTVGLADWIATNADDYVAIARFWAGRPKELRALSEGLRAQVEASPLMNASAFARDWEAAIRSMWQHSCMRVIE